MRKEDKLVLSEVLNNNPNLKLLIQEGNWEKFWEIVYNIDRYKLPGMNGKDICALFILLFGELNIGDGPSHFPSYGLYNQQDLGNICIPEGVECFDDCCFRQATFNSIKLPDTLERIECFVFDSSNLSKISLPDSLVDYIGYGSFQKCKLSEIKLPSRLKGIGSHCFCENNISEITIPESVEWLGPWSLFNINSGKNYVINIPRKWGKKTCGT